MELDGSVAEIVPHEEQVGKNVIDTRRGVAVTSPEIWFLVRTKGVIWKQWALDTNNHEVRAMVELEKTKPQ